MKVIQENHRSFRLELTSTVFNWQKDVKTQAHVNRDGGSSGNRDGAVSVLFVEIKTLRN